MRLGIGSYTFARNIAAGKIDAFRLLDIAIENGCDAVQYCENLSLMDLADTQLSALHDYAQSHQITLEVGTRGLYRESILRHAELAARFGSEFVRVVVDTADWEPTREEVSEAFESLAPKLKELGVTLAMENHDRFHWYEIMQLTRDHAPATGICLDTANSLGCLEGIEALVGLAPLCINFHAKDVAATRKPDMLGFDILGTPLGKGQVPFTDLIPRLSQCKSVTLEQWVPAGENAAETEMAWGLDGIRALRSLLS